MTQQTNPNGPQKQTQMQKQTKMRQHIQRCIFPTAQVLLCELTEDSCKIELAVPYTHEHLIWPAIPLLDNYGYELLNEDVLDMTVIHGHQPADDLNGSIWTITFNHD